MAKTSRRTSIVLAERIERKILLLRGEKVMLVRNSRGRIARHQFFAKDLWQVGNHV